eukprot:scaffold7134_cov255-Prasinococcus_capsulatus_cf.AAC.2
MLPRRRKDPRALAIRSLCRRAAVQATSWCCCRCCLAAELSRVDRSRSSSAHAAIGWSDLDPLVRPSLLLPHARHGAADAAPAWWSVRARGGARRPLCTSPRVAGLAWHDGDAVGRAPRACRRR